jgi:hypothetical protein
MVIGNWQDMERKKRKSFLEQNQDNGAILRSSQVDRQEANQWALASGSRFSLTTE